MKQITNGLTFKGFMTLLMLTVIQTAVWAQEGAAGGESSSGSSSSTTTKSVTSSTDASGWYSNPWVWVIGAAVFILLLIALMRGNSGGSSGTTASRTDRVTVTKSTDTNV